MTDHARHFSPHHAAKVPTTGWDSHGQHRFRSPAGILIDAPFPIFGGWVAVIWADPTESAGWRRVVWQADTATGRGWLIPDRLAYADIVEFGSDPTGTQRWYGIVESYEPGQWLTLQGSFATPSDADRAAERLLAPDQHVAEHRPTLPTRARQQACCRTRPPQPRRSLNPG